MMLILFINLVKLKESLTDLNIVLTLILGPRKYIAKHRTISIVCNTYIF